jgi:type II secretory pathway predicted ATPase ExeA
MRVEVMQHFGLELSLGKAGYYETAHLKGLMKDVRGAIGEGRLIAVCGVIGSGKTVMLRRLQEMLEQEKKVTVSKSLAIDKSRVKLATLVAALFYDLSQQKQVRIPGDEKRERDLRELVRKNKRPVALFVDEAHDLNGHTLTGLKRLVEVIGQGRLSVVLAGRPKLRNDLRRRTMEEIGPCTDVFSLDGIAGSQREYIHWLIETCSKGEAKPAAILSDDAIDLLDTKLRTPLQIQQYLSLALEAAYQAGEKPRVGRDCHLGAVAPDRRPGTDPGPARLPAEGLGRAVRREAGRDPGAVQQFARCAVRDATARQDAACGAAPMTGGLCRRTHQIAVPVLLRGSRVASVHRAQALRSRQQIG